MPVLCCGRSSDVVESARPVDKPEEDENNNGETKQNETADETTHTEDSPGPSNGQPKGLLKSSPSKSKKKERVNIDASTSATSVDTEAILMASRKGRRPSKKRASLLPEDEEKTEEEYSSEKISQKSTPSKRQKGRKHSLKQTDDMEMNPLDPGFFNTSMMQTTQQLYSQQTFEEEDEEFVENVEEERRKNKMRQRLKKKHSKTDATQPVSADPTQAAYERAQQEIDKVLGPRPTHTASPTADVAAGKKERRRSKQRSKKDQAGEDLTSDTERPVSGSGLPPSESLEEMKSRVHALLDDAFSLLSNSYSSIGFNSAARRKVGGSSRRRNRVAPQSPARSTTASDTENAPPRKKSVEQVTMPEVEEIQGMGFAPKPGEKLHTPLLVERTHDNYDASGLISWSPYRASDESARIVLPESQPSDTKAPVQEKTHTTTFSELTAGSVKADGYYATQPGQPIIIRTQKSRNSAQPKVGSAAKRTQDNKDSTTEHSDAAGDSQTEYTSYPGLEAYQDLLSETTTTTAHFSASSTAQRRESTGGPVLHRQTSDSREEHHAPRPAGILSVIDRKPSETNGEESGPQDISADLPPRHRPPSRNVGNTDEKDVIASSLQNGGTSAKELVDSIRQELQSMSSKMLTDVNIGSSKTSVGKVTSGLDSKSEIKRQLETTSGESKRLGTTGSRDMNIGSSWDSTRKVTNGVDSKSEIKRPLETTNGETKGPGTVGSKDTNESASVGGKDTTEVNGVASRQRKPMKKPRRAFESN